MNKVFIEAIGKHIGLYDKYIRPVTEVRSYILEDLAKVVDMIDKNPNDDIAFTASIRSSKGTNLPDVENT